MSATRPRGRAGPFPTSAVTATATSGGAATARTLARGIHGQLIAVDGETVVTILSSWPAALEPELEAVQLEAVARVGERLGRGRTSTAAG